jgi:hypothetical protein
MTDLPGTPGNPAADQFYSAEEKKQKNSKTDKARLSLFNDDSRRISA